MDLALSEEQKSLKKTAREFVKRYVPKSLVRELEADPRGFSEDIWRKMAELEWMGWAIPAEYGGVGGSFLDLGVLLEEMGRGCLPSPFFSTVILGAFAILEAGNDEQRRRYLPRIAKGEAIFTLALTEANAQYEAGSIKTLASTEGSGRVIDGTKVFVPDAEIADYFLCVARTGQEKNDEDGTTIFLVDAKSPGIVRKPLKTMAGDKLCEVVFERVGVPGENVLGKIGGGWSEVQRILERAAAAKCCEMVGAMQQVLEMTVEYAQQRKQFGRAIGSFQIIQDYCATMATDVDASRFVTYRAIQAINEGRPCRREVAIAKAWTSQAWERTIGLAHQIHGAIGVAIEHDLHFYTMRGKEAALNYGNADFWLDKVAQEMGL